MENVREFFNAIGHHYKSEDNDIDTMSKDLYYKLETYRINIQNKLINLPNKESIDLFCSFLGSEAGFQYVQFERNVLGRVDITPEDTQFFKEENYESEYEALYDERRQQLINKSDEKVIKLIDIAHKFLDELVYYFIIVGYDLVPHIESSHCRYMSPIPFWGGMPDDVKNEKRDGTELERIYAKREFNSIFTQAQLATMFRLMRDKKVFHMKDTELASFITSFAGGSHQRTRGLLGGENAGHINMTLKTKSQATDIQNLLREIIDKIEDEKKDIIE